MQRIKVIHLISSMQLGGVEKGINLSIKELNNDFDYKVVTLSNHNSFINEKVANHFIFAKNKFIIFSIIPILIQLKKEKPDILVLSLWKSYLVGWLAQKILKKDTKIIAFIHNEKYFHWVDKFFTQLILKKANIIAFDSKHSQKAIQHLLSNTTPQFVIPYIFNNDKTDRQTLQNVKLPIRFLYAGRLHESKNLEKVLDFFFEFKKIEPQFLFDIYGTGSAKYQEILNKKIDTLQLNNQVRFKGVFDASQTSNIYPLYHFYIQMSNNEGMAMSVVDSMIHGVIPIVTPVGEIKNYVTDHMNGFIVQDNSNNHELYEMGKKIHDLFLNEDSYLLMKQNCANHFKNESNYIDAFKNMINSSKSNSK